MATVERTGPIHSPQLSILVRRHPQHLSERRQLMVVLRCRANFRRHRHRHRHRRYRFLRMIIFSRGIGIEYRRSTMPATTAVRAVAVRAKQTRQRKAAAAATTMSTTKMLRRLCQYALRSRLPLSIAVIVVLQRSGRSGGEAPKRSDVVPPTMTTTVAAVRWRRTAR